MGGGDPQGLQFTLLENRNDLQISCPAWLVYNVYIYIYILDQWQEAIVLRKKKDANMQYGYKELYPKNNNAYITWATQGETLSTSCLARPSAKELVDPITWQKTNKHLNGCTTPWFH